MSITCPHCRYENTETANFCVKCGASVTAVGSVAAGVADSAEAPDPAGPGIAETPFGYVNSRPAPRRTPLPPPPPPIFTPKPLPSQVGTAETPVAMPEAAVPIIMDFGPKTRDSTPAPLVVKIAVWIGALLAVAAIATFVDFINR